MFLKDLGLSSSHGCNHSDGSNDHGASDSPDGDNTMDGKNHDDSRGCASGSKRAKVPLPKEIVESLMNGELVLPYSDRFSLPSVVPCSGGCQEAYYCNQKPFPQRLFFNSDNVLMKQMIFSFWQPKQLHTLYLGKGSQKANFLKSYKKDTAHVMDNFHMPLLLEAWKPISFGHKRRWWECIALPEDVDPSKEAVFRMEIKELAFK